MSHDHDTVADDNLVPRENAEATPCPCVPPAGDLPHEQARETVGTVTLAAIVSVFLLGVVAVVAVGVSVVGLQTVVDRDGARSWCKYNLRNLGLGIEMHAEIHGRLPPQSHHDPSTGESSFFSALLPYVEHTDVHRKALGAEGGWANGNHATRIRFFTCPMDANGGLNPTNGWATTSYSTNALLFAAVVRPDANGHTVCESRYTLDRMPDGTSTTIALVERYSYYPSTGHSALWAHPCGGEWGWHQWSHAYGMWSTGRPEFGVTPAQARFDLPGAGHTAGVQVLLLDGNVRLITPGVGQASWDAALRPDDGLFPGTDW